ncbi:hypothetical protein H5410_030979 [Solanum commersonii]|uniref:Uncharacterized protein n=1 Tax=Solanum commersonii TaxID=4109 RepID=A0A9J5YH65_SOLCO|nr:hypothetical protein H5410_030979 [Solanum commersonii]
MGINTRSSLRLNSCARSARSCCGRLSRQCLGYRMHNISIRSGESLNMSSSLLSCASSASIDINSSSVSTFNSACVASSPYRSLLVSGASLLSALSISEVKPSALSCVTLVGWEEEDVPGVCEGEEGVGIPEGSEARVDKNASADNESTSTSGELSVGAALLLLTSSHVNWASICRISVEEDGVTFILLAGSRGTPARRHNSVI